MKRYWLFILLFCFQFSHAQDKPAKKPEYVLIVHDTIISKTKLDEYGKQGYIKSMRKGVSDEERERLSKKLGEPVGDKEFIILVSLYTEAEKAEMDRERTARSIPDKDTAAEDEGYILKVNDTAKDFTLQLVNGKTVKLSDMKGKVVLVNFWATWCGPCLMEFYDIPAKILGPNKNKSFAFLPISIGENRDLVQKKMLDLDKKGIHFTAGYDPNQSIWSAYATKAIPKNYLIDQYGVIRYVSTGNAEGNLDKLAAAISKLLGN